MEIFRHSYLTACEQSQNKPDAKVMSAIDRKESGSSLILSTFLLDEGTCKALSWALSIDVHLTHLDLSDCMLQETGLIEILRGLESNTSVHTLILKGNNIKGDGTQAIGKLLRHNGYLQKLNLEWNAMGVLPEKFFIFCEALTVNTALKELDLRNNKLDHQCAVSLCEALTRNTSLESLGLQWNSFGLLGGRAVLKLLVVNKSLTRVPVEGNNMPLEIQNGIEIAVLHNAERKLMFHKHSEEARYLAGKLADTEGEKNKQVKTLLSTLEKKEEERSLLEKTNSAKIAQLEQEIADKTACIQSLTSKHEELESSLASAEKRLKDLSVLLSQMEAENEKQRMHHKLVLANERREKSEKEAELHREIQSKKDEIFSLQSQVKDFKQKDVYHSTCIEKLKTTITKLELQIRNNEVEFSREKDALRDKHAEELSQSMLIRQQDISRVKEELADKEKYFEQRIKNIETQKRQFETEVSELKSHVAKLKLQSEQRLEEEKQKLRKEQSYLKSTYEEKISVIEAGIQKKEQQLQEQNSTINEYQTKKSSLQLELEELNFEINKLRQALQASEEEYKLQVAKVQFQFQEDVKKLDKCKEEIQKLNTENASLKQDFEETSALQLKELSLKDDEIKKLKDEISTQNFKTQKLLENEVKRATDLQNAFMTYINDVRQTSTEMT